MQKQKKKGGEEKRKSAGSLQRPETKSCARSLVRVQQQTLKKTVITDGNREDMRRVEDEQGAWGVKNFGPKTYLNAKNIEETQADWRGFKTEVTSKQLSGSRTTAGVKQKVGDSEKRS